jgi:hypothetical protein
MYRLWWPVVREVGMREEKLDDGKTRKVMDGTQAVHRAVVERMGHRAHVYQPGNVREYLGKDGSRVDERSWP